MNDASKLPNADAAYADWCKEVDFDDRPRWIRIADANDPLITKMVHAAFKAGAKWADDRHASLHPNGEHRIQHDCDEGLVCCDGCRHTGHVFDLPENHAEYSGSTLESRLRKLQARIRRSDVFISHFPSPPITKSEIVDLLVEAATVCGIQRGMLAKQHNANHGADASLQAKPPEIDMDGAAYRLRTAVEKTLERHGLTFDVAEARAWLKAALNA